MPIYSAVRGNFRFEILVVRFMINFLQCVSFRLGYFVSSVCLYICGLCLFICLSTYVYTCLSIPLFICLSIYICSSISLSISFLFIYLSLPMYECNYLAVYRCIYLYVCLPTYLYKRPILCM